MTVFTSLSLAERNLVAGGLFLVSVSLLALVLYEFLSRVRGWKFAFNCLFFVLSVGLTSYTMCAAVRPESYFLPVPWLWSIAVAVPLFTYSICAIIVEHAKRKDVLSPSSVKETLDNLDSGICLSDGNGRIILINKTMAKLASVLLGRYPQMTTELLGALSCAGEGGEIEKLDDDLYLFPSGKVWRFVSVPLEDKALSAFMQTTAQDVTEVYNTNEEIRAENVRIREAIEETQKLMVRLADRVREQETLALKIKVHNDIGASLVALAQILSSGNGENAEEQLRDLQHAVWHLNTSETPEKDSFDDVKKQAKTMGIALMLDGNIPEETSVKKIIVLAAQESVTNCFKHAEGDVVNMKITENGNYYTVTITDNGKPPKGGRIKEGGGLTSLRQTVENAGGEMLVSVVPGFTLILNIPKGEVRR